MCSKNRGVFGGDPAFVCLPRMVEYIVKANGSRTATVTVNPSECFAHSQPKGAIMQLSYDLQYSIHSKETVSDLVDRFLPTMAHTDSEGNVHVNQDYVQQWSEKKWRLPVYTTPVLAAALVESVRRVRKSDAPIKLQHIVMTDKFVLTVGDRSIFFGIVNKGSMPTVIMEIPRQEPTIYRDSFLSNSKETYLEVSFQSLISCSMFSSLRSSVVEIFSEILGIMVSSHGVLYPTYISNILRPYHLNWKIEEDDIESFFWCVAPPYKGWRQKTEYEQLEETSSLRKRKKVTMSFTHENSDETLVVTFTTSRMDYRDSIVPVEAEIRDANGEVVRVLNKDKKQKYEVHSRIAQFLSEWGEGTIDEWTWG